MKKTAAGIVFALGAILIGNVASAGPESGHPNIIAARKLTNEALEKMHAAQAANGYDMDGHAAKAEQLLREAEHEMKLAAEAANKK